MAYPWWTQVHTRYSLQQGCSMVGLSCCCPLMLNHVVSDVESAICGRHSY